ncbi:hypothetical protein CRM79_02280 [Pantoea agglomerans]|nr:hypothetical protein CRM79_02280 [Pantoea agglomerans]
MYYIAMTDARHGWGIILGKQQAEKETDFAYRPYPPHSTDYVQCPSLVHHPGAFCARTRLLC